MKTHVFVCAGAVVVAAFVAGAGFLLYDEIDRFQRVHEEVDAAVRNLNTFYEKKPFPSAANVERERNNVAINAKWLETLLGDLRKTELHVTQVSPAIFLTLLDDMKKNLNTLAEEKGVSIPSPFEYGFDRYARGDLPRPSDVTRLNEQLLIMQALCQILFEGGATRLRQVLREEFEEREGADAAALSPRRKAQERARERAIRGAAADVASVSSLYTKQRFVFVCDAKEAALIQILNRIACLGPFAVVASLDVTGEGSGIKTAATPTGGDVLVGETHTDRPKEPKERKTGPQERIERRGGARTEAGARVLPGAHLTPEERIVCGPKEEKPMLVRLTIDVYKFQPGRKAATTGRDIAR